MKTTIKDECDNWKIIAETYQYKFRQAYDRINELTELAEGHCCMCNHAYTFKCTCCKRINPDTEEVKHLDFWEIKTPLKKLTKEELENLLKEFDK